eukprot:gene18210-21694_t
MTEVQFNLDGNKYEAGLQSPCGGRLLLAATKGVLVREMTLMSRGGHMAEAQSTWEVILDEGQAYVQLAEVDPGAGLQWIEPGAEQ